MSSTESDDARELAAALFDEVIVPLADARAAAGQQPFYALRGDGGTESYFITPARRVMSAADFEFPGGGTATGLAEALAASWYAEGNPGLAAMAPALKAIADAMTVPPDDDDDSVSPLIYTMF